jgi:hypothetical protein
MQAGPDVRVPWFLANELELIGGRDRALSLDEDFDTKVGGYSGQIDLLIECFENKHELRVSSMDRIRNLNLIADRGYRLIKTCIDPPRTFLRIGEPSSSTPTTPPWNRARRGNSSQNDGPLR